MLLEATVPKHRQGGQPDALAERHHDRLVIAANQGTVAKTYNFKMANLVQFHRVASKRIAVPATVTARLDYEASPSFSNTYCL